MKNMGKSLTVIMLVFVLLSGCKEKEQNVTLFDKELADIKKNIDGKWSLISAQNNQEFCEYEGIVIEFKGDKYVWTEDGKSEPGDMNWRKKETAAGYEAYLMDVFYASHPAYPLSVSGDTLYIQDCSKTAYKYLLLRKK